MVEVLEKIAESYKSNNEVKLELGKYSAIKPLYNAKTEARSIEYESCDGCDGGDGGCSTCDTCNCNVSW